MHYERNHAGSGRDWQKFIDLSFILIRLIILLLQYFIFSLKAALQDTFLAIVTKKIGQIIDIGILYTYTLYEFLK